MGSCEWGAVNGELRCEWEAVMRIAAALSLPAEYCTRHYLRVRYGEKLVPTYELNRGEAKVDLNNLDR